MRIKFLFQKKTWKRFFSCKGMDAKIVMIVSKCQLQNDMLFVYYLHSVRIINLESSCPLYGVLCIRPWRTVRCRFRRNLEHLYFLNLGNQRANTVRQNWNHHIRREIFRGHLLQNNSFLIIIRTILCSSSNGIYSTSFRNRERENRSGYNRTRENRRKLSRCPEWHVQCSTCVD